MKVLLYHTVNFELQKNTLRSPSNISTCRVQHIQTDVPRCPNSSILLAFFIFVRSFFSVLSEATIKQHYGDFSESLMHYVNLVLHPYTIIQ